MIFNAGDNALPIAGPSQVAEVGRVILLCNQGCAIALIDAETIGCFLNLEHERGCGDYHGVGIVGEGIQLLFIDSQPVTGGSELNMELVICAKHNTHAGSESARAVKNMD